MRTETMGYLFEVRGWQRKVAYGPKDLLFCDNCRRGEENVIVRSPVNTLRMGQTRRPRGGKG